MRLSALLDVERIDEPIESSLADAGRIVRRFGDRRDSRSQIFGVELDDARVVVKHADADTESIGWLESAARFHTAVRHPAIAPVHGHVRTTAGGLAVVEEWVPGEVLVDGFDPTVADRGSSGSPYLRFLSPPVDVLIGHVERIIDAYIAVADAGFVSVDFYDGCVVHDFERRRLSSSISTTTGQDPMFSRSTDSSARPR